MANEKIGLLGRKLGMTQLFTPSGEVIPVTVIEAGPCTVLQVKSASTRDGYNAIKLGFGKQKVSRATKADLGQLKAAGLEEPPEWIQEIRLSADEVGKRNAGDTLAVADLFEVGGKVDVIGTSKGRGFAGVMKRHHFAGFVRTHGTHEYLRHGGAIGTRLTPGHVLKGKKMAGQMGNERVTVQNLEIARVDAERNLIFVRGGVPGPKGGLVTVRQAVKG